MQRNRPAAIEIPEHPRTAHPARFFSRATGTRFEANAEGTRRCITLYDQIGPHGVSARDFRAELQHSTSDVLVRINSPGGDVFDGLAIYADLRQHPGKVRVEISGIAASAASLIAMAGDEIAMAPRSFIMIHNSRALSVGDARTHTEIADVLRQIDGSMADTYAERSGQERQTIQRWMNAETWLGAHEAKDAGFIDEIEAAHSEPHASFDLSVYANAPIELQAAFAPSTIDPNAILNPRDYERFLRDAGMSRSRAKALAAGYRSLEQRDANSGDLELAAHIAAQATKIQSFEGIVF